MTYGEILSHLNISGSEASGDDFETMAKTVVNFIYNELLVESEKLLEERTWSLTLVTDQAEYGFPLAFTEVTSLLDETDEFELTVMSKRAFDAEFVGRDETNERTTFAYPYGKFGVQSPPATAGTITIESSDATDTGTDYQIVITGQSSSVPVRETITFTGTTAVLSANSYDASSLGIERLVVTNANNAEFTGNVIVKDSDGNTLATIPPFYEKSPTYVWYSLYPTPSEASTLKVRGMGRKPPLVASTDWPEIDVEFHDLLVWGSEQILLPHAGKTRMGIISGNKYEERKKKFLGMNEDNSGIRRGFANVTNPFVGTGAGYSRRGYYRTLNINTP